MPRPHCHQVACEIITYLESEMTEQSAVAKQSRSQDRSVVLRRNSDDEIGVHDRILSNSGESPERRKAIQFAGDARNQTDCTGDDSCTESECERLSKYPDYCRTITIRGLPYFYALNLTC